jgi:EF hand
MGIPDDRYFVQMMESAWQICEDEESSVFKEQIEFLTKTVRQRLLAFANKNSDEYILRQIFKDFDANKSGSLTIDELTNVLAKIQVSCERKYITALLKKFDTN